MSEPKAKQIVVDELVSGGHTRSSAEYLVNSLAHFARADALEEAAKVAGECHFDEDDPKNDDRDRAYAQARRHAAADIRALKEKQGVT